MPASRNRKSRSNARSASGRHGGPSCSLLVGGDVAPNRRNGPGLLGKLAPLFAAADIAFVNLEHPLSPVGKRLLGKPLVHRGQAHNVEGLLAAGLDAVTLANNHIFDFGEEAMFDTFDLLDMRGLPRFGAGRDLAEARAPVILERNGLTVGLLGFTTTLPRGFAAGPSTPGVNPVRVTTSYQPFIDLTELPGTAPEIVTKADDDDLARLVADIRALSRKVDAVLVYGHWGTSQVAKIMDFQREIGEAAIDAGADAVFGGHQHVLAPIQYYKGKPIVHGTGNLVFDIEEPFFTEATQQTVLFGATLTSYGVVDPYLVPCLCGVGKPPRLLSAARGAGRAMARRMAELCAPEGVAVTVAGDRMRVRPDPELAAQARPASLIETLRHAAAGTDTTHRG
jgi:poly-gamma-glutamate capsule biosynthesis protein CapA/YwtB (metallophosphatase superfamily)